MLAFFILEQTIFEYDIPDVLCDQNKTVLSIEKRPDFEFTNNNARLSIQSTKGYSTPIWDHGLKGEGQVIGLADTVSDSCDRLSYLV